MGKCKTSRQQLREREREKKANIEIDFGEYMEKYVENVLQTFEEKKDFSPFLFSFFFESMKRNVYRGHRMLC